MDVLMRERKEAQEAAATAEASKKGLDSQANAYLNLMPLALPAPPLGGGAPQQDGFGQQGGFGGGYGQPQQGFGQQPAYGGF